ncbi:MAG: 2-C-methyl-D-erythritol 4-phosphate cytidylyltransferase [Nitrospiria bacterium]
MKAKRNDSEKPNPYVYAIIPAAGSGIRFGGKIRKQFLELAGTPIFIHTLNLFQQSPVINEIICVVPREDLASSSTLISRLRLTKVTKVISGGVRRQDSVSAAVEVIDKKGHPADIVLVHDGVRPLATASLIKEIVQMVEKTGAAVASRRVTDSLKEVFEDGTIQRSLPRDTIWSMQTPQGFRLSILSSACQKGVEDRFDATDEAMLVERLGIPIHCVEGPQENIKITTASDLKLANAFLRDKGISKNSADKKVD